MQFVGCFVCLFVCFFFVVCLLSLLFLFWFFLLFWQNLWRHRGILMWIGPRFLGCQPTIHCVVVVVGFILGVFLHVVHRCHLSNPPFGFELLRWRRSLPTYTTYILEYIMVVYGNIWVILGEQLLGYLPKGIQNFPLILRWRRSLCHPFSSKFWTCSFASVDSERRGPSRTEPQWIGKGREDLEGRKTMEGWYLQSCQNPGSWYIYEPRSK